MTKEEDFSKYILKEENEFEKMKIVYYLKEIMKKSDIYFYYDKAVLLKVELAKMFIEEMNLSEVNKNIVLTALLLCECKKQNRPQDLTKFKAYAQESADFLRTGIFGFKDDFCEICETQNRYLNVEERTNESDVIELVEQFGGMLMHRYDRQGFPVEDALILLTERNMKNIDNKYLDQFVIFVNKIQQITVSESEFVDTKTPYLTYLAKVMNKLEDFYYE